MSSWIRCKCDQLVHTNMFCGTGISLIVEENYLDVERHDKSAEDLISEMIVTRTRILECQNCNRAIVLDEKNGITKFYAPEPNALQINQLRAFGIEHANGCRLLRC